MPKEINEGGRFGGEIIPRIESEKLGIVLEKNFVPKVDSIPSWEFEIMGSRSGIVNWINLIKKYQPEYWNPHNPILKMAKDFHYFVYENLMDAGLIDDDINRVGLYTARNSVLDKDYSADFFVEYYDKEFGKNIFMTVDLKAFADSRSIKNKINKKGRADFVLNIDPDFLENIGDNYKKIEDILRKKAKELVGLFVIRKYRIKKYKQNSE